ncbi:MAG: HEAT repeat domain-containing protein [Candidatus Riflebacteria bacterium]|nr:HEAT repeat domain-containing protein [Candidatus Riflebacteria bacterium]
MSRRICRVLVLAAALCALPGCVDARSDRARILDLLGQAADLDAVHVKVGQRIRAVNALVAMGPKVVAVLVERLDTRDVHEFLEISNVLARIGRPATPALAGALDRGNARTRRAAARVLREYRDRASHGPLARAIDDPDPRVREDAALALAAQRAPQALPLLAGIVSPGRAAREDPDVVKAACCGVSQLIGDSRSGRPPEKLAGHLAALLVSGHLGVRHSAAVAVERIGPAALKELEPVIDRFLIPGVFVAVGCYGRILGAHPALRAGPAGARFVALLSHPDPVVRARAFEGLATWGLEGKRLGLARLSAEPSPLVRQAIMSLASRRGR